MIRTFFAPAVVGGALVWLAMTGLAAAPPVRQSRIGYHGQIEPIIKRACLECHSQDRRRGGLSLATYSDALDGGRNGAVILPGNGAGSPLVHHLTGALDPQMPKDEDPLPAAEIALIQTWIDQGARETPDGPPAPQPWEAPMELERPTLAPVVWGEWTSPIDRTVAAYLAARHVTATGAVDDALYARRVYLDIWGLLPTPEALATFVSDPSPRKRDALVGQLLDDGDKYAEHWITFWNDLLRNEEGVNYAGTRKSITKWLLQSLQENKPFNRMVEQLLNPQGE